MASVWEARQHDPDRVVAIKILNEDISQSPEDVESFYAEAKRAAELDHENIVTVFEVGCQNGRYYYVMELAAGYDTGRWLRRKGQLKPETIAALDKYNSLYAVIPPVTALLESKVSSREVMAYPEEGMEAFHRLYVTDFPCVIAAVRGKSIYDKEA